MNLAAARELKQEIWHCARRSHERPPVSIGIRMTSNRTAYRVAVLLHTYRDRHVLETSCMRAHLRSARHAVDVEVLDEVFQLSGRASAVTETALLGLGASIGHFKGGDGSLGFFAVQRSTGRRGIVSCSHVIAFADGGVDGDAVIAPSASNGGRSPRNRIGSLDGRYPRLGDAGRKHADCAFAALDDHVPYDPARVDGGMLVARVASAVEHVDVTKIGCVSGARKGVVAAIELDNIPVRYGEIKAFFDDVIQIGATSASRFAAGGDSGALIYTTHTRQPVGLLFATSYSGGPFDAGWSWAHPIDHVLRALDVDVIVE